MGLSNSNPCRNDLSRIAAKRRMGAKVCKLSWSNRLKNINAIFAFMEKAIIIKHIEESAHHFLVSVHKEGKHAQTTGIIIRKYIETGHITHDEEKALKLQLADTLKICGVMVPFVLIPGASVIMPILIKVAGKHNINLLPSVA